MKNQSKNKLKLNSHLNNNKLQEIIIIIALLNQIIRKIIFKYQFISFF